MLIARSRPAEHPAKMTGALQNVARQFDPDFSSASVVTGVWLRENSRRDFLTQSSVAGVTGGVVLMLSALGIYGVVGLMVATRTREIAVRVALGATRRRIIGTILADVLRLVTPGVTVGVILAVAIVRVNSENMGIALSAIENIAYVYGAAIAILVAVIASLAPPAGRRRSIRWSPCAPSEIGSKRTHVDVSAAADGLSAHALPVSRCRCKPIVSGRTQRSNEDVVETDSCSPCLGSHIYVRHDAGRASLYRVPYSVVAVLQLGHRLDHHLLPIGSKGAVLLGGHRHSG